MAYINQKTGSSNFNVKIIRKGVVSFATDNPEIIEEQQEFTLKLISDVTNDEQVTFDELTHVPDEEIDADGYWVNSKVSRLKSMSQEELISYILKLESGEQLTFDFTEQSAQQLTQEQHTPSFETLDLTEENSTQQQEEVLF